MSDKFNWERGPGLPELNKDEVHIWCASQHQSEADFNRLRSTLSEDETVKANKYVFEKDQVASIVARGLLRTLLGAYLKRDPKSFHFVEVGNGKPALKRGEFDPHLYFNISHSGTMVLYGFTYINPIGVDIELKRPLEDALQISESYFSENEKEALRNLSPEKQHEGFFNCWSRKEAFIKVYGEGLSRELDSFDVSLRPGEPARLLSIEGNSDQANQWTLEDLNPIDEYAAAYCIEATPDSKSCFLWQGFEH